MPPPSPVRERRRLARLVVALTVWPLAAGGALLHAQSATGSIEGLVVDPSAGVLPGVLIVLVQPATGIERRTETDADGRFRAPLLPVGIFELTATRTGFEPLRRSDLRVSVGQTLALHLELLPGVTQDVVVSADAPVIDTSRTSVSSTVDAMEIRNLPVNGRNFIDFVLLTPGVTRDVRAGDLSFAGARGTLNSLLVDGVDNNNTFFGQALGRAGSGRAPYQLSADVVEEFRVSANAYAAEYGRAGGGVINVVTRSGTNVLHGSLFEFYRDKALNATNPINELNGQPKSPYHYNQFGGTLGGPLRPNRDFYFVSYDGQRSSEPNLVVMNVPPGTPDDPATAAGIARLEPLAYSWSRRLDQDVYFAKTDHQVSDRHRLTFRYNHQDFTGENFENGGLRNAFEHTGASLVKTRTFTGTWASVLGTRAFNELRVQYAADDQRGEANSATPEAVVLQNSTLVLIVGRNNFSPRETTIDRVQVADSFTWLSGPHGVKAGFDVQLDRIWNDFPGFFSGSYVFPTLASFGRGRPVRYQQSFPGPGTSGPETTPDVREYSVFVQDEWRPRRDLTANAGLRYDLMTLDASGVRNPDPQLAAAGIDTSRFEPDTNNIGPRLGVAWNPGGRPLVIRGGWGVFFGRAPASLLAAAGSNNGINVVSVLFTGAAVPTYPAVFANIPEGVDPVKPNIFYVDEAFANPRVTQASAAVEMAVARDIRLAVTYLYASGMSLTRSVDRNLGTLRSRTFTIDDSGSTESYHFFDEDRPFESFQRVIAIESSAESRYHGLTVELDRRMSGGLQWRLAYTLGRVTDTVPDATAIAAGNAADDAKHASNPADFEADRTVGQNDQRHRLVANGVYMSGAAADGIGGLPGALARGWTIAAILTATSGKPYSARVGNVDLNGDGNTSNDLAPGTRRNAFRLNPIVALDLRLARDVPLGGRVTAQLIAEAFNLFNRDNISAVTQQYYTVDVKAMTLEPTGRFGSPTASAGERIVQLAIRVAF